jgi:hypothetical protein
MKFNYLFVSVLAISLTACSFKESKKDEQIDPVIKSQIHILNNQIVDGIVKNKPADIFFVSGKRLLEKRHDIEKLLLIVKGHLKKQDFRILNEYYQKNMAKKHIAEVNSGEADAHEYSIRYESLNKEMYVVVGYFKDNPDQKCFTFFYGKQGNSWKLNYIEAGIYKKMNKDAVDWYQLAQSDYKKGYLIDAMCNMELSTQLLKPANHIWHYAKEKEIQDFERKVSFEVYSKHPFPLTIDYVKTKPRIFKVFPQAMVDGYFPLISYTTTIDLGNSHELAMECNEIDKNIESLFKGLNKNNKKVLYRPYKTIPTGVDNSQQPGFIKENK